MGRFVLHIIFNSSEATAAAHRLSSLDSEQREQLVSHLFARVSVTCENRAIDHGGVSARPVHQRQRPGREGPRQERRPVGCGGEAASFEVEVLLEETRGAAQAKRG